MGEVVFVGYVVGVVFGSGGEVFVLGYGGGGGYVFVVVVVVLSVGCVELFEYVLFFGVVVLVIVVVCVMGCVVGGVGVVVC